MCRGQAVIADYININKVLKKSAKKSNAQMTGYYDRILCEANEKILTKCAQ